MRLRLCINRNFFATLTMIFALNQCNASAGTIQLPSDDNVVATSSWVRNFSGGGNAASPTGLSDQTVTFFDGLSVLPQSVSRSVDFNGPVYDAYNQSYNAGNFTVEGSATIAADKSMHLSSAIDGNINGGLDVYGDSQAQYWDVLTITGPQTPARIVFHFQENGTSVGLAGGSDWTAGAVGAYGMVFLSAYGYDPSTGIVNDSGFGVGNAYFASQQSSTDISTPWNAGPDGQFVFLVQANTYGRVATDGNGATGVDYSADFTVQLTGVSEFDASGNDITSLLDTSFITTSTTPEPATWFIVFSGFGVFALIGKRKPKQRTVVSPGV